MKSNRECEGENIVSCLILLIKKKAIQNQF